MKTRRDILNGARVLAIKDRKKKIFKIKLYLALFLFLALIVGLVFLSRSSKINIDQVNISGNKVITTEEILSVVESKLAGYYLFVFPRHNIFLYPKAKIKRELLETFKRIAEVDINRENFREITITAPERIGKYLWCSAVSVDTGEKCYFVDKDGYTFDEAPNFSGSAYFKLYGDLEAERDPTGQSFLGPEEFGRLMDFYEDLNTVTKPIKLSSLIVNLEGDYEFGMDSTDGKIIFKKENDFDKLLENFASAIKSDPLKTDFQEKLKSLLYIDLRFDNKVYFKFQE